MDGVNPDTVWTWNAIGKRAGAWNLDPDAPEFRKGFLLNHLISELLPDGWRLLPTRMPTRSPGRPRGTICGCGSSAPRRSKPGTSAPSFPAVAHPPSLRAAAVDFALRRG